MRLSYRRRAVFDGLLMWPRILARCSTSSSQLRHRADTRPLPSLAGHGFHTSPVCHGVPSSLAPPTRRSRTAGLSGPAQLRQQSTPSSVSRRSTCCASVPWPSMPMAAFASATAFATGSEGSSESSSLTRATFCAIVPTAVGETSGAAADLGAALDGAAAEAEVPVKSSTFEGERFEGWPRAEEPPALRPLAGLRLTGSVQVASRLAIDARARRAFLRARHGARARHALRKRQLERASIGSETCFDRIRPRRRRRWHWRTCLRS